MAGRSKSQVPRVLRGSVVLHRRRCGRPTCRCADGEALHESFVLSYSDRGRTRFLMLPPGQVEAVRRATDRYRAQKAKVEELGNQGLGALVASLDPKWARP